jgi:hypothetical protein
LTSRREAVPINLVFLVVAAACILLAAGFVFVFTRLIFSDNIPAFSDDSENILSARRYQEMERLLDVRLSCQQGDSMVQLRKDRIRVFRCYIHQLADDFDRICTALKMAMVNSQVDRPDLAGALMRQQFLFTLAIMAVEFRLIQFRFGWSGVSSEMLTESLRLLSAQSRNLAAIAQPEAPCY